MAHGQILMRPVDVLHIRGNRRFADMGHGEAVMPPWPTLFAGALRSRILVDHGGAFADFRAGRLEGPAAAVVGRGPDEPGTFRISSMALRDGEANLWFPVPADLTVLGEGDAVNAHALVPVPLTELGVKGSFALPGAPVLRTPSQVKARGGWWIRGDALVEHLRGRSISPDALRAPDKLWRRDRRLGIALGETRTAQEGMLYTAEAVALAPDVSFAIGVRGADGLLPTDGLVRLGGDARGAEIGTFIAKASQEPWRVLPDAAASGFRMILATPGLFPNGSWLPPGVARTGDAFELGFRGLRARLVAAAVPRGETVSGWNLAKGKPKAAERAVPAGAVYWFERRDGDLAVLEELSNEGLWPLWPELDPDLRSRRAEGFNNVWFGEWAANDLPSKEG